MDYVYDRCEAALADGSYLAGKDYTLADIAILPYVQAFAITRPELPSNSSADKRMVRARDGAAGGEGDLPALGRGTGALI